MGKIDWKSIELQIDEVTPCFGGIIIRWSSNIRFGEYTIYRKSAASIPASTAWVAESEHMDSMTDECFPGVNPIATLENYGSLERSNLTFKFDKMGHVQVNGWFMNKDAHYSSGILFDVKI